MSTPDQDSSPASGRKRATAACDLCRLKKAKCDGRKPCSRCKAIDNICIFTKCRTVVEKKIPDGYVDLLERQHAQLVSGVQELFKRLQQGKGWVGPPLEPTEQGAILTHEILARLELQSQSDFVVSGDDQGEEVSQDLHEDSGCNEQGPASVSQTHCSSSSNSTPWTSVTCFPEWMYCGLLGCSPIARDLQTSIAEMSTLYTMPDNIAAFALAPEVQVEGAHITTLSTPADQTQFQWPMSMPGFYDPMDFNYDIVVGKDDPRVLMMPGAMDLSCMVDIQSQMTAFR